MTGWEPPTTQYKGRPSGNRIGIYPFQEKCSSDNPKTIWSEVGRLNVTSDLTTHPLVTPPDPPSGVGPPNVPPYGLSEANSYFVNVETLCWVICQWDAQFIFHLVCGCGKLPTGMTTYSVVTPIGVRFVPVCG